VKARSVRLGSNEFLDCEILIALGDRSLLAFDIEAGKLLASLDVPSPPATAQVLVDKNRTPGADISLSGGDQQVTLVLGPHAILRARLLSPDSIEVDELDLRPLGLAIFADDAGLAFGRSIVADNTFVGARVGVQIGGT